MQDELFLCFSSGLLGWMLFVVFSKRTPAS